MQNRITSQILKGHDMNNITTHSACSVAPRTRSHTLASRLMAVLDVWRSRHHLSRLEPHMLNDLGISESQARKEAKRPIWDVPAHWIQ
jgi:uncharacterized protein YjiS (DUF1127 family)